MTLNRSSFWTKLDGERLRVKHMSLTEISCAVLQIEDMEFERLGDDPYIVQQLCACGDFCNVLPQSNGHKDGFALEDWLDLFRDERVKRLKIVLGEPLRAAPKATKTFFLVKWFKFW